MKVQIYAHKTVDEAVASARAGVDLIGVSAGENGRLPLEQEFAHCRAIFSAVRKASEAWVVALTVAWFEDEIAETVAQTEPDVIHLSGEYDLYDPAMVGALRKRISPVKVMMAIPVAGPDSIDRARRFASVSDLLILDTDRSHLTGVGASGETHDWDVSAEIVRRVHIPVILAGGLSPDNVREAIQRVRPWAVDSYTHTNRLGTAYKDLKRVKSFVEAARGFSAMDARGS